MCVVCAALVVVLRFWLEPVTSSFDIVCEFCAQAYNVCECFGAHQQLASKNKTNEEEKKLNFIWWCGAKCNEINEEKRTNKRSIKCIQIGMDVSERKIALLSLA